MRLEGFGEFLARDLVDLLDGLLGVADGIDQVLPLRAQEFLALLRFLIFLHGRRHSPAPRSSMRARTSLQRCSASAMASASGMGSSAVASSSTGDVQFFAAGLVEELQLGLFAHQFDFDLRALFAAAHPPATRSVLSSSSPARRASRMRGILRRPSRLTRASRRGDLFGQQRGHLVELDVVGQQARALFAQAFDLGGDGVAARGGLAELLLEARHGVALAAMALFEAGQSGASGAYTLRRWRRLALRSFSSSWRSASRACSRSARRRSFSSTAARLRLALRGRFFGVAAQALEFQARHRKARIGARQIFAQLAHFVIERHAVFLARLLQGAQAFQLGFEADDLAASSASRRAGLFVERAPGVRPVTCAPVRALRASWPADRRRSSCRR